MGRTRRNVKATRRPTTPSPSNSLVREYVEALVIALALAIVIRAFLFQAYKIPSGSMEPTLLIGDHILVNKIIFGLRMPDSILGVRIPGLPYGKYLVRFEPIHRGDVVVFVFPPDPTKDFIKRVIGLPGDQIAVRNGRVWRNGVRAPDSFAQYVVPDSLRSTVSPRDYFPQGGEGAVTVPPDEIFVMGDNRDRSYDSRFWGFVPVNNVEGRAVLIYWSWNSLGAGLGHVRWSRFGKLIH